MTFAKRLRVRRNEFLKRLGRSMGVEVSHYRPAAARRVELLESHDVTLVLDVGANRGQYATSLRSSGYKGDILSFEPADEAFRVLAAQSACDSRWHPIQAALGAVEGFALLHLGQSDATSSLLAVTPRHIAAAPNSAQRVAETVPAARLDSVLAQKGLASLAPLCLKMDVQGSELQVLSGGKETLKRTLFIECEMSIVPLYHDQPLLGSVLAALTELGFHLIGLEPGFRDPRSGEYLQFDGTFVNMNRL